MLTTREGKQGWAPLQAGDKLAQGSVIRVESSTGGEVGVNSLDQAMQSDWTRIHQTSGHTVYQLNLKE